MLWVTKTNNRAWKAKEKMMNFDVCETKTGYNVVKYDNGRFIKVWNKGVPFEDGVYTQAGNLLKMPFVKEVCLMPDAHIGMGSTVGSVIATQGAILPAAVGVDIGCGMQATRTDLRVEDAEGFASSIFAHISKNVPHGRSDNGGDSDIGRWRKMPNLVKSAWDDKLKDRYIDICKDVNVNRGNKVTFEHLGTLGTGNHFCSLSSDLDGYVWLMVHSGSRGVGARTGGHFMRRSKEMIKEVAEKWYLNAVLPDPDLAYLPQGTDEFSQYLKAVLWCQDFARESRNIMMRLMVQSLADAVDHSFDTLWNFDCHHNYIGWENHNKKNLLVTRKGAIRAKVGDFGIIPGSMGQKSYIVEGLGNKDSLNSCSHGAGRVMSRTQAKKEISIETHIRSTEGVVCDKTLETLDESPDAYKNIDNVIEAERDLVKVLHTLKEFVNIKGVDRS
jgi:tRNA-splicing ligase RtcB